MEEEKSVDIHLFHHHIPLAIVLTILIGFSGLLVFVINHFYVQPIEYRILLTEGGVTNGLSYGSWPALENPEFFASVKEKFIAAGADFIESDLSEMRLRVYQDGEVVKEIPILSKGKEGSWWETPAGLYQVQTKREKHFSSFGQVYLPWNLPFQGNFFIHGWPYYSDGTPVAEGFSGGCIRLSEADAKEVFDLAEIGIPILVFEKDFSGDAFSHNLQVPGVAANNYLAADLANHEAFVKKDSKVIVPIASITKLMTAVVATEYINIEKKILITESMLVKTSKPRLEVGDQVPVYDLLFLLLQESSNEAAEAIARHMGRIRFLELMNEKAHAIGMEETRFSDASGADSKNVSTTEDLFALAQYLYNNRSFILDITAGTVSTEIYGPPMFSDLKNFNEFDTNSDFIGGKVGLTTAARETILAIFEFDAQDEKRPIVIIVLGSDDRVGDAQTILDWIKESY